jgi:hypothetical protein
MDVQQALMVLEIPEDWAPERGHSPEYDESCRYRPTGSGGTD